MSESSLVPAKIRRPHSTLPHPRTDLLNLLDELRTAPLIIVSGLRGAGKASLLASYAATREVSCLWYQVDSGDQDLATFFRYLNLAVSEIAPSMRSQLPQPSRECLAGVSDAIKAYFSELYRCLETPFLIVLNDYQEISDRGLMHRVMREACAGLPPGGRFVLISSNDNPPSVACLRADRSIAIVGWQELQLYPGRVKEMAAEHDLSLPLYFSTRQLQSRIGDWAAELVLALRAHDG